MSTTQLENCGGKSFVVPTGLKCLLEELSREVLRRQPENIYEFLANYLEEKCRKQCGPECHKNVGSDALSNVNRDILPNGGAMTGTTEGYFKNVEDNPFGMGPTGMPIIGPSRNAPFGYGPDGNPLTALDPRAPNGYGPDGNPLPGAACVAPFGYDRQGKPLKTPDAYAPFGYHLSDGLPVATNDPTAPFGFGPDGNPLSSRDPNAPLGYNTEGALNTFPETVAFCGDKDYPSGLETVLNKAQSVAGIVQRIEQRDGFCGDSTITKLQDAQIQAGAVGRQMLNGQPFAGDTNLQTELCGTTAGMLAQGLNQQGQPNYGQQMIGMGQQVAGTGQQLVFTGQQMTGGPVQNMVNTGQQMVGTGHNMVATGQQMLLGGQQGQNTGLQASNGLCCDGGVVFFGSSGANLLMSYSPTNIPNMSNAISCGMQMGGQLGTADCAGAMRTAMDCMLTRVMTLLSSLMVQAGNNNGLSVCGNVPNFPGNVFGSGLAPTANQNNSRRNKTGTTGEGGAFSDPIVGGPDVDDDNNFGIGATPNVNNNSKCNVTNQPGVIACNNLPAPVLQNQVQATSAFPTDFGEMPAPFTGTLGSNTGGASQPFAGSYGAGAVESSGTQPTKMQMSTNKGAPVKPRQRCIPKELWQYVPISGGGVCPGQPGTTGAPAIPPRQGALGKLQVTGDSTQAQMGEYVEDILNRAQDIIMSTRKYCAGSMPTEFDPPVSGPRTCKQSGNTTPANQRPILCGNSGLDEPTGPGSMGKYLKEIAPQYQKMFSNVLSPDDQTTLTLLTTVGTLLDTIEETGLTRLDPVQLCSNETLKSLTDVSEQLLQNLKEHLAKVKSSSQQNADPYMNQITREAYDALDIGAESLAVAVGLLKDVTNLCGELSEHPELLEKCTADLQMARQNNQNQYNGIAAKQVDACNDATKQLAIVTSAQQNNVLQGTKSALDNELCETDASSAEQDSQSGASGKNPNGSSEEAAAVANKSVAALIQEAENFGNQGVEDDGENRNNTIGPESQGAAAETEAALAKNGTIPGDSGASNNVEQNAQRAGNPAEANASQFRSLMNSQMRSVHNMLSGESSTTGGRIVFLTVSFVVGMVVGYAVARALGLVGSGGCGSNRGIIWASPQRAIAACSTGAKCASSSTLGSCATPT
ncbi:unnamed protein product [Allacma fusca]|uniref:RIIa domain-containing protein n=1 Tax=Allacma fusca TaxID=39272 RepID=A0A8J2PTZ0_9HEXA|nr:unnamed protein product [Allacma fusca]